MAAIYVDSNAGGTNDGTSKTNAFLALASAIAVWTSSDTIYVSDLHSETASGTIRKASAGAPVPIFCYDHTDAANPPTTRGTGAVVANAGALIVDGDLYCYGITFRVTGAGSVALSISSLGNGMAVYEQCRFELAAGISSELSVMVRASGAVRSRTIYNGCTLKFNSANNISVLGRNETTWLGCTLIDSGGSVPTVLFKNDSTYGQLSGGVHRFVGCDFSQAGAAKTLFEGGYSSTTVYLIDCKLNAALGTLMAAGQDAASLEVYGNGTDSAGGNNNFGRFVRKFNGSSDIDTSQYITLSSDGGSADEATSYSFKLTGNGNSKLLQPFYTEWLIKRYGTTGASKTAAVEILYDGAADLKDDEAWLEVCYLSNVGDSLATFVSDRKNPLAAGQGQTGGVGTAAWTKGAPSVAWRSQKLSVTFTPQKKGYVMYRVAWAANKVGYMNPNLVIT